MGLTFRCEDASWSSLSTCESSLTVGTLCRSQSFSKGNAKFAHASLISSSSEEISILKRAYLNNQKAFCHASKEWRVYLCQCCRTVKFGMINFWRWVCGFFSQSWVCKIHPETAKYTQNRSWDMYLVPTVPPSRVPNDDNSFVDLAHRSLMMNHCIAGIGTLPVLIDCWYHVI